MRVNLLAKKQPEIVMNFRPPEANKIAITLNSYYLLYSDYFQFIWLENRAYY